jgi:hypothetical protein
MTDEEQIWSQELAILEGRERGDLSPYLNAIAPDYLGWPPVMAEPLAHNQFKADSVNQAALKGEIIAGKLRGFTVNGDTALCYFSTHRTMLGEGFAQGDARIVDQHYENVHVWVRREGEWKLFGGMARLKPSRGPG